MKETKLIIIGGFLGAGKTTTILRVAENLVKNGYKIGIVTNDQGTDLVDTHFLASSGFSVLQVEGGCFCTNIDDFLEKIERLAINELPDIIIAEPIGSSADLIGKVFRPLNDKKGGVINICPLTIIVDPKRIKRLLLDNKSNFHSEIDYLFQKQLQESDIIALNKIDNVNEEEKEIFNNYFRENYKEREIVNISAKEGENIDKLTQIIINGGKSKERKTDIEKSIFEEANNHLGWINITADIKGKDININDFIEDYMEILKELFQVGRNEIGHFKVYGEGKKDWAKASLTTYTEKVDFYKKSDFKEDSFNLVINIRADIEPYDLLKNSKSVLKELVRIKGLEIEKLDIQ